MTPEHLAGYRAACQELIDWCDVHQRAFSRRPKTADAAARINEYLEGVKRVRDVARVMIALPDTEVVFMREVPQ